jgi:hypothetical protein
MPNITVALTDTEYKSLEYAAVSVQEWAEIVFTERARVAKEHIIARLVAHCNANNIAIATGEDAQVTQAFDLGVVIKLADAPELHPPADGPA